MMTQTGVEWDTFNHLLKSYFDTINQNDALQKFRTKAWERFLDLGLPTKKTEVYRYIKVRNLFSQNYHLAPETSVSQEKIASFIYPECKKSVLIFVNGHYMPQLSNIEALPSNVTISPVLDATRTYGTFLNNFWSKSIKEETDPFAALNRALYRNGLFIYIPPKTVIEAPIQILHIINTDDQPYMFLPHVSLFAGIHSQVKIYSSQKSFSNRPYFVNALTELAVEEGAHVHLTQSFCDEHPNAWHLDAIRATVKRSATFKTICATEGSQTVRNDYKVALAGENAEALLNGVSMLSGKNEAHTNVHIHHQAPFCKSYQLFKNVVNGFSKTSFEGKILVDQEAQKTEAFQLNNNLILNDHAHADSKPNLEIYADDVKASHGATIGQLDEDQLFYMRTRGFPEREAKSLLIYGFCEQVIEMIDLPSMQNEITQRARRYLKGEA